jgi:sugar/nucleoside kinase (ribokinase family)
MSKILVVGSIGYDSIKTPMGSVEETLGGSASYFSYAASLYAPVAVVGVVGTDCRQQDIDLLQSRGVNLLGLQRVEGKTFRWEGEYEGDCNEAITRKTELNVFQNFSPQIPPSLQEAEYLFLANIDPDLQLSVLKQTDRPRVVGADTMNFWIDSKRESLIRLFKHIDIVLMNEAEAKKITGCNQTLKAALELSQTGPKAVIIKRGEYGFVLLYQGQFYILPAFPIVNVVDPTGAGDTFAAGFFGSLARHNEDLSLKALQRACLEGLLLASFTVQGFGLTALASVDFSTIEQRHREYTHVVRLLDERLST